MGDHTCDKATPENRIVTCASDRRSLDDYTNYEDTSVDQDGVFAGDDLGKEARVDRSQPCAELEDRHQPAHLRRILNVAAHVSFECLHHEDAAENSLVVAVEETMTGQLDISHTVKTRAKD